MEKVDKQRYYIKDKTIFSQQSEEFFLPSTEIDLEIPTHTKNPLILNKSIIKELENLLKTSQKTIELSKEIKDKEKIIKEIKENPQNLQKPKDDDYEFIEKTSQLLIIDEILQRTEKNNSLEDVKNKINQHIKNTKNAENEKISQLEEDINIEKSKIKKINFEKTKSETQNLIPQIEKIKKNEKQLSNLESNLNKLETQLENTTSNKDNSKNIKENIVAINHDIKNIEFDIKILKTKKDSLKSRHVMGKKCINIFLFILTLGLIYWTKYSDCKYQMHKIDSKINNKKENIANLQKKKYNLEKELEIALKNENMQIEESENKKESIKAKIREIKKQIEKNKIERKEIEKKIEELEKESQRYKTQIDKIDEKLIEFKSIKEEFEKYSCIKVKKSLDNFIEKNQKELEKIKELKRSIEEQKIDIDGDWIYEFESIEMKG